MHIAIMVKIDIFNYFKIPFQSYIVDADFSLAPIDPIGHFRVPKNLTFKTSLSAKPLL